MFKMIDEVYSLLRHHPGNALEELPRGPKSNVHYLVANTGNCQLQDTTKRAFWDDCGVWQSGGPVCKRTFINNDGHLSDTKAVNGKYCIRKVIEKRRVWVPIGVQPTADRVVVIRQMYAVHKSCSNYRKRVSWIESEPSVALYEYCGTAPTTQCQNY